MTLRGTMREPVATGAAHIDSGQLTFPFGTLSVDDGFASLSGNDPRGPNLQAHASGRTLDYEVSLAVNGPLNEANIVFSSTPPLSSEEILLLLTVGEVPQQQYTFTTSARAGRVATYLGKDLFSRFSGSDATESKLIINTGESISEEGKLTYSVEYLFTDRWSIIGEYDRFNAYNASLKWKILSR
jgi:translocation and assembly module TamB